MPTFFTAAKPFRGHDGIIERNALKSWVLLHPDVDVILFGDMKARLNRQNELGLRHEPHIESKEFGTKDDGSTDTATRLQKFGTEIRYLYKANGGTGFSFQLRLRKRARRSRCVIGRRRRVAAEQAGAS